MREQITTPQTRFAVLLELAPAGQQLGRPKIAAANFHADALTVALLQLRFVIEHIHLRRAAIHEEEDAGFCLAGKVSGLGPKRVEVISRRLRMGGKETVLLQQRGQSHPSKACPHLPQELATRPGTNASGPDWFCRISRHTGIR